MTPPKNELIAEARKIYKVFGAKEPAVLRQIARGRGASEAIASEQADAAHEGNLSQPHGQGRVSDCGIRTPW